MEQVGPATDLPSQLPTDGRWRHFGDVRRDDTRQASNAQSSQHSPSIHHWQARSRRRHQDNTDNKDHARGLDRSHTTKPFAQWPRGDRAEETGGQVRRGDVGCLGSSLSSSHVIEAKVLKHSSDRDDQYVVVSDLIYLLEARSGECGAKEGSIVALGGGQQTIPVDFVARRRTKVRAPKDATMAKM